LSSDQNISRGHHDDDDDDDDDDGLILFKNTHITLYK